MNNYYLKLVLLKIKEYDLVDYFKDENELNTWLNRLKERHISNFLLLNGDKEKIGEMFDLVTNIDLLNRDDYIDKINALLKVNNAEGWYHLFDRMANPNFWNSDKFYSDVEMMAKAPTAQYVLWVIGEHNFIKSPYHDEDLRLIVETRDKDVDNHLDFLYWDALATVANDHKSINSPYHREDMKLISEAPSFALQSHGSYPERGINRLACNQVSLNDPYHLDNMKILASNSIAPSLLYELMTDEVFIHGKYYREEINVLANAKDYEHALSLFYLITNPNKKYNDENLFNHKFGSGEVFSYFDYDVIKDKSEYCVPEYHYGLDNKVDVIRSKKRYSMIKEQDEYYLEKLNFISNVPDNKVFFVCSLIMNKSFMKSANRQIDLDTLLSIDITSKEGKELFKDVYGLILDNAFMNSKYHLEDLKAFITCDEEKRKYLRGYITEINDSDLYHEYDIKYLSEVDLSQLSREVFYTVKRCLFTCDGKMDSNHINILEQCKNNIQEEIKSSLEIYVDKLIDSLTNAEYIPFEFEETKGTQAVSDPVFEEIKQESKIKKLFKRKR